MDYISPHEDNYAAGEGGRSVGDSPQQPKLHLQLYKHLLIKY